MNHAPAAPLCSTVFFCTGISILTGFFSFMLVLACDPAAAAEGLTVGSPAISQLTAPQIQATKATGGLPVPAQAAPSTAATAPRTAPGEPLPEKMFTQGQSQTVPAARALLWFENNHPTDLSSQALDILANATDQGLNPDAYNATDLHQAFLAARHGSTPSPQVVAELDQALTRAMIRFLNNVHFGRVNPRQIQENFTGTMDSSFKAGPTLEIAIRKADLQMAVAAAEPSIPLYSLLRDALRRYRNIAASPETNARWQEKLPPLPNGKVKPGEQYAGLPLVAGRLQALGDLDNDVNATAVYTPPLVAGIKNFQERHGLTQDGVIGRMTYAHLNATPAHRVRQIELTMERLRWTPLMQAPRLIVVNVPEQMLEAYEVVNGTPQVKVRMRVITGNAKETRTPLFDSTIKAIEFSPYWNVPLSIAKDEIIPRLMRKPGYFDQQGFEFVPAASGNATLFSESLDAVLRGAKRIRQRPGPRNPMGDIKFVMPNKDSIFLHHTASPQLFSKQQRDLSHGCVRVEDPVQLAKFVLNNDPNWDDKRIHEAMGNSRPTILHLRNPVRVVIEYKTAQVRQNGQVYFFSDIYGQDKVLDQALRTVNRAYN